MLKKTLMATLTFSLAGCFAQQAPAWQSIAVSLEALCSDGSPYRYYEYHDDPRKLVLDFMGGGACWNDLTCRPGSSTYVQNLSGLTAPQPYGIYDKKNKENPVAGWSHVFVPYCTGDVHLGNRAVQYQGATVHHKGAVNARAVLNDVFKKYPDLEQILVTGCSAGAYGSIMWAPYLMQFYPRARVVQFGDAGLGVAPEAFGTVGMNTWGAGAALPSWIEGLKAMRENPTTLSIATLYNEIGKAYPQARLSEVTSSTDLVQIGFYGLMKGVTQPDQQLAAEWMLSALQQLENLTRTTPNFSVYVYPGQQHCVINRPEFYSTTVGGVQLTGWLKGQLEGRTVPPVLP